MSGIQGVGDHLRIVAGADLLVSGDEDLSGEVAGLLMSLQPPVNVHFVARHEVLATLGGGTATRVDNPEAIFAVVEQLDTTALGWMRRVIASSKLPLIAIVRAHPAQRSNMRELAREVGAVDCLIRSEISPAVLEASIAHARTHNRQLKSLLELRERFSVAIQGARDGMWEWDIARERVYYSQRWREMLDLAKQKLPQTLEGWLSRVHPQDVEKLRGELEAASRGEVVVVENEHRIRDGSNEWRWVLSRAVIHRNAAGKVRRMAGSLTDITPYRRREKALREQSRYDSLTKLPDRRVFLERCARAVELSRGHGDYQFVVLIVVVDRLSQIRDSFGIGIADEVFVLMAKRLRACLRPEDQLFRYSAGKFAILLEDVEAPSFGTHIANRIQEAVAEPFEVEGKTNITTVSIGMTTSANGYERVDDVVTDASTAVDNARGIGNRHAIFTDDMKRESRSALTLEMDLHSAIQNREFELYYQPLVSAIGHTLIGFEALLRWKHPEKGLVSPAEFIPIAEASGLIIPIGRWVIKQAIRTLRAWQLEYGYEELVVSVNLSAKQVADDLLLDTIDSALGETGLPPTCLKLELTESVMMKRIDAVKTLLQEIRARGVQLWIDDFGTGYSSLAYLHRFPVDGLKIDRSFVRELDGTPASSKIIRTILSLADNFELSVVAEGIETEEHAAQLTALGCPHLQGYLFGRPAPDADIRALLSGE